MRQIHLRKNFLQVSIQQIFIYTVIALLVACGGTRNAPSTDALDKEEVDIDKLLGIDDSETTEEPSDEDEVLRILGIMPEPDPGKPDETEKVMAVKAEETSTNRKELDRLRQDLEQREKTITGLQANLGERDRRIQALRAELEKAQNSSKLNSQHQRQSGTSLDYSQRYVQAREFYERHKYQEAINIYSELLTQNDKNQLSDNCQYWIGECYYGLGNYEQSIVEFEKVFTFPKSDKSDDTLLKLGLCYIRIKDRQQARSEFEQLLANYPKSEYVGKARLYLSKL